MNVRTNSVYVYRPALIDRADPPHGAKVGTLRPGMRVRVVRLPGCPPPNTMRHTHIADPDTGDFLGLVCTGSLEKRT